ncbi:MAG: hypothetical protein KBG48_10640 [Kofleriaceae bacterium]|jgi:hypothetical protein|nr:hypothetical protein [Kofleriaceae bacterium]MBP9167838.1 hypothetical protein [Kofleriaceae bacterium]MBP9859345.1 hypothetical protein [Kofleriaceae bacterium]
MPTVRYRLRTPVSYWLGAALLLAPCGYLVVLAATVGGGRALALLAFAVAVPAAMLAATAPYWAWPGGHLAFTDDEVIVRRGRRPLVLRRADGVQATIAQVTVQVTAALIPIADLDRGQMIAIGSGARTTRLSTLLIEPSLRAAVLADVARAVRGQPAQGSTPPTPPSSSASAAPPTALDARLDAELDLADR